MTGAATLGALGYRLLIKEGGARQRCTSSGERNRVGGSRAGRDAIRGAGLPRRAGNRLAECRSSKYQRVKPLVVPQLSEVQAHRRALSPVFCLNRLDQPG